MGERIEENTGAINHAIYEKNPGAFVGYKCVSVDEFDPETGDPLPENVSDANDPNFGSSPRYAIY